MKSKILFYIATLTATLSSPSAFAQDGALLAYENSQRDSVSSVDDDINAALAALDEVNAILDARDTTGRKEAAGTFNVDAIIAAADKEIGGGKPAGAPAARPARQEVKPQKAQTAPESVNVPAKAQLAASESVNAPAKAQLAASESVNVPAKAQLAASESVNAPAKAQLASPESVNAPAKAQLAASATKPDVKNAPGAREPASPIVRTGNPAGASRIAPDGTRVTDQKQTASLVPAPSKAPHTLSMSYVMAVYRLNGVDLGEIKKPVPGIGELYQHAFSRRLVYQATSPAIGDLAFFHNTLDRNRDGRWNDWHTLVGIVESIDADETVTVLCYRTDKIERIRLNLKYPELHKGRKGQILNTQIRPDEGAQKGTSAKLFAGFANLLGNASSVTVIDNWTPGMKVPM